MGDLEGVESDVEGTPEDPFQGHWDPETDDVFTRLLTLQEVRDASTFTVGDSLQTAASVSGDDAQYNVAEAEQHANVNIQPEPIQNIWVNFF